MKQNRNNWRVWINKLYTCIDLDKLDEAIQASLQLIEFKSKKNSSEEIPEIEEKCVRAIIGKSVHNRLKASESNDKVALDSAKRTLNRCEELLNKLSTASESKTWIWEVRADFDEMTGRSVNVLDHLMKEYRSIQAISNWETNHENAKKMCNLVLKISDILKAEGSRPNLIKSKLLLKGIINKLKRAYFNKADIPEEITQLESYQNEIETIIKKS